MIYLREKLEELEAAILAPYALLSKNSRGRLHPENESRSRTAFQRDRDRIIHTTAFRRLEYKTQVFVFYEGDHYRTRLTHTLEVAQLGRSIARGLGANEDLAEAICLAHDLGHAPFGHAGEHALNIMMADQRLQPQYTELSCRYRAENRYPLPRAEPDMRPARDAEHETDYDQSEATSTSRISGLPWKRRSPTPTMAYNAPT